MARDWSHREVTVTVEAYFDMLSAELNGMPLNKTAVRRALLPRLDNRTNGSIEFKNCNISAALLSLGLPSIGGYKPRRNYQKELLHAVIGEILERRTHLFEEIERIVEQQPEPPKVTEILSIFDNEPPDFDRSYKLKEEERPPRIIKRNYLEIEARNRFVGLAGEELVVNYEKARLIHTNREKLANRVEHVSFDQGDGAGFDIRSFDETGNDLFIEVKTTRFRKETPFFITANEVQFSARNATQYALYRVYHFTEAPKIFSLHGNISNNCELAATTFRGSF